MTKIYQLLKAEKLNNGTTKHLVLMPWTTKEESTFSYQSVRVALVWPSTENPAYIITGGMEVEDKLTPSDLGVIRIIEENECEGLSLETLFDAATDSYGTNCADSLYLDRGPQFQDFYLDLMKYCDRRNLRSANIYDISHDLAYRWGKVDDFNKRGCLLLDKGGKLFSDIQGISRDHLKDPDVEKKYYRLNGLSYLVSGFAKFPPTKPFNFRSFEKASRGDGWMGV